VCRLFNAHRGRSEPTDPPGGGAGSGPPSLGGVDGEDARERLDVERRRLEDLRAGFDAQHLHDETEEESFSELSHIDNHPADTGSETFEREKDFSILEQVEAELEDVERALRRLDDGTYGRCQACGGEIPDDRLEAMPAARFCVEHQAAAEHQLR
jgi:RNA polymerase-binding transcription factor DksA